MSVESLIRAAKHRGAPRGEWKPPTAPIRRALDKAIRYNAKIRHTQGQVSYRSLREWLWDEHKIRVSIHSIRLYLSARKRKLKL